MNKLGYKLKGRTWYKERHFRILKLLVLEAFMPRRHHLCDKLEGLKVNSGETMHGMKHIHNAMSVLCRLHSHLRTLLQNQSHPPSDVGRHFKAF